MSKDSREEGSIPLRGKGAIRWCIGRRLGKYSKKGR